MSSQLWYGLTTSQANKLANNYAQFLEKVLSSWQGNKTAGKEWHFGFMTWHKDLSIWLSWKDFFRIKIYPEATKISREPLVLTGIMVTYFSRNLKKILNWYKFEPADIYNCDETFCLPGSLSLAHQSDWMTTDNFFKAMEHFVKHVKCSKEILLLIGNHKSNSKIKTISLPKTQSVVILTFPSPIVVYTSVPCCSIVWLF